MPFVRLSQAQVRELSEVMQTTHDAYAYRKAQLLWLRYLGKSISEIAKITNTNERTLYRWLHVYRQGSLNGLFLGLRRGRRPKITEEYKELLFETIAENPQAFGYPANRWTLKLLVQHMTLNTGIEASFQRVWQILVSRDVVFRVPRAMTWKSPDFSYSRRM